MQAHDYISHKPLEETLFNTQAMPHIETLTIVYHGKEFTLQPESSTFLMGRSSDCQLQVLDEAISRHHCKIIYHHHNYFLLDTSQNGLHYHNRLSPVLFLNHGSIMIMGDMRLKLARRITPNDDEIIEIKVGY